MELDCPENTENDVEWRIIIFENIKLYDERKYLQKKIKKNQVPHFFLSH